MNYYEHHIGDYAQDTAHLTFLEDAAYSRLIRRYYATEKPLPNDLKSLQRLVGARSKDEREAVETVLAEFFTLDADGYHNKRCDEEIAHYIEKRTKAKRSADARWLALQTQCEGNAPAMRTHEENHANALQTQCEGNALQTPDTSNQEKEKKRASKPALGIPALIALGVPESVAADWLRIRSAKRAPLTETAVAGIQREARKAGMNFPDAVQLAVERGWQGFEASWVSRPAINGAHPRRDYSPPELGDLPPLDPLQ